MTTLPAEYQIKERFPELDKFSREELQQLMNFFSTCIFKNSAEADKNETLDSAKNSYDMITAFQYQPPYDTNLAARKKILENYRELNPYYLDYLIKIGDRDAKTGEILVPRILMAEHIVIARSAANNDIIWHGNGVFSDKNVKVLKRLYAESLLYYNAILHNEGFSFYNRYWNYTNFIVSIMAMEQMISYKFNKIFDIDDYNERDLRNAFASYGLEFFNNIPDKYRKRLLKNLNEILKNKGTDKAFVLIANIFGFENVNIFKYFLVKNFERTDEGSIINLEDPSKSPQPKLFFAEVPYDVENIEEAFLSPDTLFHEYNNFISTDPFWQAKENEVAVEQFNYLNTKYLSMTVAVDMLKKNINVPAFYNFLKGFKLELEDSFKTGLDFMVVDNTLSKTPIHIADLITAMQLVLMHSLGYEDTIVKDWKSVAYLKSEPRFHGFNDQHLPTSQRQYFFADGTIVYGNGTVIQKSGTAITPQGIQIKKDGSFLLPDGNSVQVNKYLLHAVTESLYRYLGLTWSIDEQDYELSLKPGLYPSFKKISKPSSLVPTLFMQYHDQTLRTETGDVYTADKKLLAESEYTVAQRGSSHILYATGDIWFYSGELLKGCKKDEEFSAAYLSTDIYGKRIYSNGYSISAAGDITKPDGSSLPAPSLTIVYPDGSILYPSGMLVMNDNTVWSAQEYHTPVSLIFENGWRFFYATANLLIESTTHSAYILSYIHTTINIKTGSKRAEDSNNWETYPDIVIIEKDGTIRFPTGDKLDPLGKLVKLDGTVILPQYYDPFLYDPRLNFEQNLEAIRSKPLRKPGVNTIYNKVYDLGGSQADGSQALEALKENTSYRDLFQEVLIGENDYTTYKQQEAIFDAMFCEEMSRDIYGEHDSYSSYLSECSPDLAAIIAAAVEESKLSETAMTELLFKLISTLESWLAMQDVSNLPLDLMQSSAIIDYLLDYIRQLIEKFKAYTTQFKDLNTVFSYYDPLRETVRIREEFEIHSSLSMADWIKMRDSLTNFSGALDYKDVVLHRDRYMLFGLLPIEDKIEYKDDCFIKGLLPVTEQLLLVEQTDIESTLPTKDIVFFKDSYHNYVLLSLSGSVEMTDLTLIFEALWNKQELLTIEEQMDTQVASAISDVFLFRCRHLSYAVLRIEDTPLLQDYVKEHCVLLPETEYLQHRDSISAVYTALRSSDTFLWRDKILLSLEMSLKDNPELREQVLQENFFSSTSFMQIADSNNSFIETIIQTAIPYRDQAIFSYLHILNSSVEMNEVLSTDLTIGNTKLLQTEEKILEQCSGLPVKDVLRHRDYFKIVVDEAE